MATLPNDEQCVEDFPDTVIIRVALPGNTLQRCIQFELDETVWDGKIRVLRGIVKEPKDGLNYGFFCPPSNGRSGKFLDEERVFRRYPLPGPIGFLEFRYKQRLYRNMKISPNKYKKLHGKANLRRFIDFVKLGQVDKALSLLKKGLDPNFQHDESGETPLTVAVTIAHSTAVILALVNNGAHLDYRNKLGLTPVHVSAIASNYEALRVLLDLGVSPNCRDGRGLTPLYHCVCCDTNPYILELLLYERARLGVVDENGSTEVHQACRYGRVHHLEHLIFYGADKDAQNASGNTALHICALNNKESCARVMLFRGADKTVENQAHQTPAQVAAVACNFELVEIIDGHDSNSIVHFREAPAYNDRRKSIVSARSLQHSVERPSFRTPPPSRASISHPASLTTHASVHVRSQSFCDGMMPVQRSRSMPRVNATNEEEFFSHLRHYTSVGSSLSELSSLADQSQVHYGSDSPPPQSFCTESSE